MSTGKPLRDSDPRRLGRYRLTGRLGAGGMGIVYAGIAEEPDGRSRLVAVKVIHPHLADAREFRTRFRSEATLAARVARFSTAAVLDVDVEGEQPFLVTEFVDGPTLQAVVDEQGPLTGGALDAVAIGIATALVAIHEAGIIHRDLKPSNVILSRFGPRVIDFGIARAADVVSGLTSGPIGSPPYMAPEQFRGDTITPATDVHAWGAAVCFAGTGKPPFGVGAPEVMLYRTLEQTPTLTALDESLRDLAEAALRKDPAERPTARDLLTALTQRRPTAAPPAPPAPPAGAGNAAASAGAGGGAANAAAGAGGASAGAAGAGAGSGGGAGGAGAASAGAGAASAGAGAASASAGAGAASAGAGAGAASAGAGAGAGAASASASAGGGAASAAAGAGGASVGAASASAGAGGGAAAAGGAGAAGAGAAGAGAAGAGAAGAGAGSGGGAGGAGAGGAGAGAGGAGAGGAGGAGAGGAGSGGAGADSGGAGARGAGAASAGAAGAGLGGAAAASAGGAGRGGTGAAGAGTGGAAAAGTDGAAAAGAGGAGAPSGGVTGAFEGAALGSEAALGRTPARGGEAAARAAGAPGRSSAIGGDAAAVGGVAVGRGRRRVVVATAAAAVVVAVVAAAAVTWLRHSPADAPTQAGTPARHTAPDLTVRQFAADNTATGPAPIVDGARRGGTVDLYAAAQYWELDPVQNRFADGMMASSRLLARTLTAYREDSENAPTLVGDLATDTGRSTDGGRTWEFTIRPGVTFANGTPVTAGDVARGIARSFTTRATGATYLQRWLTGRTDFRAAYTGPTKAAPYPPGVTVPDDRTLRLRFPAPHPDLPAVAALPTTSAVPAGWRPTTNDPVPVTGPYRVAKVGDDKQLTLVRNTAWDPNTDPVRTDYPERFVVHFGTDRSAVTRLLMGDGAASGVQLSTVEASQASEIYRRGLANRLVDGAGAGHRDLCFNTRRVTDAARRRALSLAFNPESALQAVGGPYIGDLTSSLYSPRLPGYPTEGSRMRRSGNSDAARAALDGAQVTLVFAHRKGGEGDRLATAVTAAFARAGVKVEPRAIANEKYLAEIGRRDNPYDLYICEWTPDYLDGNAMLPELYSGGGVRESGSTNVTYFDDAGVNAELDRLQRMPDRAAAAKAYAALARRLATDFVPAIPFFDQRRLALFGTDVRGLFVSSLWAVPDLARVWVAIP